MLPVLMYHSVPASGPGDDLSVPRPLVDRQWRALRAEGWALRGLTEALALIRNDPSARVVGLTFDDGYADFLGVPDLLAAHQARATLYVPTSQPSESTPPEAKGLSWADLAELPKDLVEIGSHAHLHRPLDVLPPVDIGREVRFSRRVLAERLGTDVTSFCYPHGYSSRKVRQAVCAAGYTNACVVGRELADPAGDPYAVPRLQVTPAHDETQIAELVTSGEAGLSPKLKRVAYPGWRVARLTVFRTTGRMLT